MIVVAAIVHPAKVAVSKPAVMKIVAVKIDRGKPWTEVYPPGKIKIDSTTA
jgi:hypothetical protein